MSNNSFEMKVVDIYYTKIQNSLIKGYQDYVEYLPEKLISRNKRYVRWQDKTANILGKFLLIEWLSSNHYDPNILKEIESTKYGRPYLPLDIDFNISHSGDYVICAVSKDLKLGVDIEEVKNIDINSFKSVFTKDEYRLILESSDRISAFYKLWTIKESVIKAEGKGLSIPLKEIMILPDGYTSSIDDNKWFLKELNLDGNYLSYLAIASPFIKINYKKIEFH